MESGEGKVKKSTNSPVSGINEESSEDFLKHHGGYGVAVAQELVELLVWVRLPVVTPYSKLN